MLGDKKIEQGDKGKREESWTAASPEPGMEWILCKFHHSLPALNIQFEIKYGVGSAEVIYVSCGARLSRL